MRSKKSAIVILVACLAVMVATVAAGCSKDAEEESEEIQLSFIAEEYVLTGQGEPFVEEVRMLDLSGEDRYLVVLDALREAPEGMETVLREEYRIQSVQVSVTAKSATVDFASEGLSGGSMEEELLIAQIVRTLLLNFQSISSVQFTVDGAVTDTLMGHLAIDQPFMLTSETDDSGNIQYNVEAIICTDFT